MSECAPPMRVLHVPYSYPPDPPGGTEIYVAGLTAEQASLGVEPAVAAPGPEAARYEHAGIPVWRFGVSPKLSLDELYGEGDSLAAEGFGRIMDQFRPEIVHLHSFTSAVSLRLAGAAARRGVPIVFNYHTPTVSCARGTLLRWGSEICDGTMEGPLCTACCLTGMGLPRPAAALLATIPPAAGRMLKTFSGGPATALRMSELVAMRIDMVRRMLGLADRVVALCNWTRKLLVRNGVPESKITLCRQGIVWEPRKELTAGPGVKPVRLAFFGRLDATKGIHVVAEAFRMNPGLAAELDIYGVSQGAAGESHAARLRELLAGDRRVRLLAPVPPAEVIPTLARYHALLAPSQGFETGPLVVLEAFAAGVPVIGSDLGGIAELVTNGKDGLLVNPYSSAAEWSETLGRVAAEPGLLDELRTNIQPPRHSRQAAVELSAIYAEVLRSSAEESVP